MGLFMRYVLARVADDGVQLPNKSHPGHPHYSKIRCLNNIFDMCDLLFESIFEQH